MIRHSYFAGVLHNGAGM